MITPETISFLLKKGFIVMPLRRGTKDKPKVSGWGKDKDVNQEDLMRNYFRLDNLAILTGRKSNLTVPTVSSPLIKMEKVSVPSFASPFSSL